MTIMLLTAGNHHSDKVLEKVLGLDVGADEYVVKPFNFDELATRICVLLRREINISSPVLQ